MGTQESDTLVKLSDTGETIADRDEDIRGRHVKDKDGEDLGKVEDLLVDSGKSRVRLIQIASGGFLGIGQDTSFIPIDAITDVTADEVRIDQTRESVAGAPTYDPELADQQAYYEGLYSYYRYPPYGGF